MTSLEESIFRKGSTTYYFSSKFFPVKIREDVFRLYSFVRVADDYVDAVPANSAGFRELRASWDKAKNNIDFKTDRLSADTTNQRVIKNIVYVTRKYGFDLAWIESFLDSMQADLDKKVYQTLDDTLWYVYGSAEVIGLLMAKIMGLPLCNCHTDQYALLPSPDRTHRNMNTAYLRASASPSISALPDGCKVTIAARYQGRSMQFINFIRDIDEDNALGRCYFPKAELDSFNLDGLNQQSATANGKKFDAFIAFQLKRYSQWQHEANEGFAYIPKRLQLPLRTAVDMYDWTAKQIAKRPRIVFEQKVKPKKRRVLVHGIRLTIDIL